VTLLDRPLLDQVKAVRADTGSAERLWLQTRERIERLDPMLRAFTELASEPCWDAVPTEGPLAGAPIAVKANIAVEGLAHSAGIRALARRRALVDATAVCRVRSAGGVVVGTTNMSEGAVGSISNNPWYGLVRNPRDVSLTAGGSSGGSAAAVAAGMASCALGTDSMGSVRIPAAFCGLVGLKPSAGAVPTEGLIPLSDQLDTIGAIGRTVSDVTLLFSVLASQSISTVRVPKNLRVARLILDAALEENVRVAFESALVRIESALGRVRRLELDLDLRAIRLAGLLDVEAGALEYLGDTMAENPEGFSERFRSFVTFAKSKSAVDLVRAQRVLRKVGRALDQAFDKYDLLLCPTTGHCAQLIEAGEGSRTGDLCAFVNAAGVPALSLPIIAPCGLPIGLQLIARRGSDAELLVMGLIVEQTLGWDPIPRLDPALASFKA